MACISSDKATLQAPAKRTAANRVKVGLRAGKVPEESVAVQDGLLLLAVVVENHHGADRHPEDQQDLSNRHVHLVQLISGHHIDQSPLRAACAHA
jgi:hypothetical protein